MKNGYYEDLYDKIQEEIAKKINDAEEDGAVEVEFEGKKYIVSWNLNITVEENWRN